MVKKERPVQVWNDTEIMLAGSRANTILKTMNHISKRFVATILSDY